MRHIDDQSRFVWRDTSVAAASALVPERIAALLDRLEPASDVCSVPGCIHHPRSIAAARAGSV